MVGVDVVETDGFGFDQDFVRTGLRVGDLFVVEYLRATRPGNTNRFHRYYPLYKCIKNGVSDQNVPETPRESRLGGPRLRSTVV